MTVIRPNSIAGITSITAQGENISFYSSDGVNISQFNANINATSGVSTIANLTVGFITATGASISGDVTVGGNVSIAGTLTYEDVTNVDSIGIVTARAGIVLGPTANTIQLGTGTTISSPSSDTFTVLTNGAQRINIEADGDINIDSGGVFYDATNNRLAIGSSTPDSLLDCAGGNITLTEDTNVIWKNAARNTNRGAIQFDSSGNFRVRYGSSLTEGYRLDSSGRLLVGTSSSPSSGNGQYAKLAVQGSTFSSTGAAVFNLQSGKAAASHGPTDDLGFLQFTDNAGNEFAWIRGVVNGTPGVNDYPGALVFSTTSDGASSPTEKLRIDNTGTIQADGRNGTATNIFYSILPSPGTSRNHFFANTVSVGTWALQGNGTSTFTSDERRKKNIETTRDGYLDDLNKLRVVKYNWRAHEDEAPKELGLIAQEVEKVFPGLIAEYVDPEEGFEYKALKHSVLPFMLLKALQEAAAKIESLEARLTAAGL